MCLNYKISKYFLQKSYNFTFSLSTLQNQKISFFILRILKNSKKVLKKGVKIRPLAYKF